MDNLEETFKNQCDSTLSGRKKHFITFRRSFWQIQNPFMVGIVSKVKIKGNLLNLMKGNYVTPKPNIFNTKRLILSLNTSNKARMSALTSYWSFKPVQQDKKGD